MLYVYFALILNFNAMFFLSIQQRRRRLSRQRFTHSVGSVTTDGRREGGKGRGGQLHSYFLTLMRKLLNCFKVYFCRVCLGLFA